MAKITALGGFEPDDMDPDVVEQIQPLISWVNDNAQTMVAALDGNLGDKNMSSQRITVQTLSGAFGFYKIPGPVSGVSVVRVVSEPNNQVFCSGFNWWPIEGGFEYVVTYTGSEQRRAIILKVEFDV